MAEQPTLSKPGNKERSLNKREVLWAIAIIIGLTAAPIVAGFSIFW